MCFLFQGPIRLSIPPNVYEYLGDLDDVEYKPGFWFLAISVDASRLLLVHSTCVTDEEDYTGYHGTAFVDCYAHYGHTVRTYSTGFCCEVFSKDTSGQLYPDLPWVPIDDLVSNSLFIGLNYPIKIVVGDTKVLCKKRPVIGSGP